MDGLSESFLLSCSDVYTELVQYRSIGPGTVQDNFME